MSEKAVKDKVLCYVVREGRLLVFRHTDYSYEEVGIQVPAGSIRPGETPEEAAHILQSGQGALLGRLFG